MKRIPSGVVYLFLVLTSLASFASAQVATGTPPFNSLGGGPFDTLNLGNLNAHFAVPVLHKAGRAGYSFTYDLSYDSSIWAPVISGGTSVWQPVNNWGWRGQTEALTGYIPSPSSYQLSCRYFDGTYFQTEYYTKYIYRGYSDKWGVFHYVSGLIVYNPAPDCGPQTTDITKTASDGWTVTVSAGASSGVAMSQSGQAYVVPVGSTSGSGSQQDANGNQITVNNSGQFFDTLSSTTPVLTITGSGTPTSPLQFGYIPPANEGSGTRVYLKVNYVNYTVKTSFGAKDASNNPIGEYSSTSPVPLVDNITLPDDTSSHHDRYTFTYEQTPGTCTPLSGTSACVTGRIAQITLPTGGTIQYTYSGGANGIINDGSTAGLTRTLNPGGTWTYSRTQDPMMATHWTTTVTTPPDPMVGNDTVIDFQKDSATSANTNSFFETQRKAYQGSQSSGTLLVTTTMCWNSNQSSCTTTAVSSPLNSRIVTLQYPNGQQSQTQTVYTTNGLVGNVYQYGYATSGLGTMLRQSSISYAALGNGIADRPSQILVYDGSNHLMSNTTYSYDESAYPVQNTSGTPQHTSVSGSRGNLTTITYSTGSSTLSKHFQYNDTGTLYKSWDVNGSSTSYTSYAYDQTTQGNSTKSCGNSFPTTVTSPPTPNAASGLSASTVWDCTGGVAVSRSDSNTPANTVSASYSDQYFWRPASSQDQLSNGTNFFYTAANGSVPPSQENSMTFGSSIAEQLTTVDGFGRVQYSQQQEGIGSSYYDSTQITYDALGRPYKRSMPYVAGAGQSSSTAAVTTTSYDALGRVTQVQDGATPAGYVKFSYSQNDVLQINGPAPSGENLKQKQLEYDALRRLISVCEITAGTSTAPSGNCGQQTALPSPPGSGYLTTYAYGVNSSNMPTTTVAQNAQPGSSGQQTRTYVYDLMGRLIQETNPETGNLAPGTTNYTFDSDSTGVCTGTYNGDLVKKVDNRGNTTCYTYDSLHRVQSITYTSGSPDYANTAPKTFVYDAATYNSTAMSNAMGRLAEAYTGPSSSKITDEFFSYSKRGELADVYQHTPNSGTPYYHSNAGYFANGVVSGLSLVSPGNLLPSQTYGVDGKGRPSSVTSSASQNSNVVSSTTYDLTNYKTTVNFGSGDSDVFTLDPKTGRLKNYTFNVGSNSDIGKLTWNTNGSLGTLQIIDTVPTTTDSQTCNYTHDDMARVASVNCGNSIWRQNFSYDAFGNITKDSTGYTGLTFNPLYSGTTNQFTSLGIITPTYDTDGRLTYDAVNHYTWDADSMLHTVDTSPTTTVTYDALGRMVEKAVGTTYTQFVYSPIGSKLAVMTGQTLQKGFVPLPTGAQAVYTSSGLAYYRHHDHLGSSRLATTPSRTLYSSTAYAPFGEPYKQTGTTDLSFTGKDQDMISGMHDFLARRYLPTQGRWLTPDPAGLSAVNPASPQSWNRYAYVNNNPLALVDPLGLDPECGDNESDPWCDGFPPSPGGAGGCPADPVLGVPDCGGGGGSGGGGGLPIGKVLVRLTNPNCANALFGSTQTAFGTFQNTRYSDMSSFSPTDAFGSRALQQATLAFQKNPTDVAFTYTSSLAYNPAAGVSPPVVPVRSITFIQPSFYNMSPDDQVANLMHELQHGAGYSASQIDPTDNNYEPVYNNILQQCPVPQVPTTTDPITPTPITP